MEKESQEWLTSIEIIEFMKQYEKTYEDFEFLGPPNYDAPSLENVYGRNYVNLI